ncbi:MAG: HPr family phosphocarrier protein [Wenzhouxiangellaceae bacterium]
MVQRQATLCNRLGLHARAAGKLVATASAYQSTITLAHQQREVNAKSIMGILMLAAGCGSTLAISASGDDAEAACDAIVQLIKNRFGESE